MAGIDRVGKLKKMTRHFAGGVEQLSVPPKKAADVRFPFTTSAQISTFAAPCFSVMKMIGPFSLFMLKTRPPHMLKKR